MLRLEQPSKRAAVNVYLVASDRVYAAMLTIWGRRSSFNVQKVMWLVGELQLAHQHIEAGGSFGGLDTAEFRRMNPHGQVPVIKDDRVVVWESHAILRYLAARYGQDKFWCNDAAKRAEYEQWMDWAQTALQPDFLVGIFWGFYRTPADQRNVAAIRHSVDRCTAHFRLLDELLTDRSFLLGDALTLADIPIGCHLYRYFNLEIERPYIPNVEAWYQRLQQRPAYQEHVMLPFQDLYGRLDY